MCCEVFYLYIRLLTQLSYLTYMGLLNSNLRGLSFFFLSIVMSRFSFTNCWMQTNRF